MVEEELKLYITRALDLVRKCLAGRMPFKMSGQDFENAPLGRLISLFKQLSDNPELGRRLDAFQAERNFLSHRAISSVIDMDGELSVGEEGLERLALIEAEADHLVTAIHHEGHGFLGYLYFEDLTKEP